MVMVSMFVFVLEASDAPSEIGLSCQPCVTYYPHCSVYGSKADLGVFFSDQIVNRGVFLRLEEYVQNFLLLFAVQLPVSSNIKFD